MLRHRLLLGPILVLALAALLWLDEAASAAGLPPGALLLLPALAVCAAATWELKHILRRIGIRTSRTILLPAAASGLLLPWLVPLDLSALPAVAITATAATAVYVIALLWHSLSRSSHGATAAAGAALLAFVYLGLLFGFFLALRREHSAWVVLGVLLVTKSCDVGAYSVGKLVGRHRLIPWLSPKKTWEGLAGGILTAAAFGAAAALVWDAAGILTADRRLSPLLGAAMGAAFALVGQAGDLMASMLKRDAGLKDSGDALPGYGGILDIVDSLLPVAPLAYWFLHRT